MPNILILTVAHVTEEDYDAFCLAYMFTYRDFEGGTLGLAWTGDLKNAGGVCEKNGVRTLPVYTFILCIFVSGQAKFCAGTKTKRVTNNPRSSCFLK